MREATAIAAYHAETDWPVIRLLLGDDAPQWALLTEAVALCWGHEGRHYTKLEPVVTHHRRLLKRFRARFWRYYHALRRYQGDPRPRERIRLERWFDRLFATRTGYRALDERIAKTQAKKAALLQVLAHPEVPLHNNAAELAARAGAETGCQFRPPNGGRGARVGYVPESGGHRQETGGTVL